MIFRPNKKLSAFLYSLEIPIGVWTGIVLSQNRYVFGFCLTAACSALYFYAAMIWPTVREKDAE